MNIEIDKQTEQTIEKALALGSFQTPSELVHASVTAWLAAKQAALMDRTQPAAPAYEAFERIGAIGCSSDGPGDLATNPDHMEGFGR
jgi:Arc/MetJ-type ribon-helix-helix transcriptional regulator